MPRAARNPITNGTERGDAFCREYVGNMGKGAAAYSNSHSDQCSASTVATEARRLHSKPHIRTRKTEYFLLL
jgi:hypothetical protein